MLVIVTGETERWGVERHRNFAVRPACLSGDSDPFPFGVPHVTKRLGQVCDVCASGRPRRRSSRPGLPRGWSPIRIDTRAIFGRTAQIVRVLRVPVRARGRLAQDGGALAEVAAARAVGRDRESWVP